MWQNSLKKVKMTKKKYVEYLLVNIHKKNKLQILYIFKNKKNLIYLQFLLISKEFFVDKLKKK